MQNYMIKLIIKYYDYLNNVKTKMYFNIFIEHFRHIHSTCDPDADLETIQNIVNNDRSYEFVCIVCKENTHVRICKYLIIFYFVFSMLQMMFKIKKKLYLCFLETFLGF